MTAANSTNVPSARCNGDATIPCNVGCLSPCDTTAPPSEPGNICVSVSNKTGSLVIFLFEVDVEEEEEEEEEDILFLLK